LNQWEKNFPLAIEKAIAKKSCSRRIVHTPMQKLMNNLSAQGDA